MNRLLQFFFTFIGGCLALYLQWPWYTIAIIALIIGVIVRIRRRAGFWFAFLAGLFVWGGYVTYVNLGNDGLMAQRMAALFGLGSGWWMVFVTAFWGGLTAGLGGWTGVNLRKAIFEKPPKTT